MSSLLTWKEFNKRNQSVIDDTPEELLDLYRTVKADKKPKIKSAIKNWRRHERKRRNFCAPNSKRVSTEKKQ